MARFVALYVSARYDARRVAGYRRAGQSRGQQCACLSGVTEVSHVARYVAWDRHARCAARCVHRSPLQTGDSRYRVSGYPLRYSVNRWWARYRLQHSNASCCLLPSNVGQTVICKADIVSNIG